MKTFTAMLMLALAAPAFAQESPKPRAQMQPQTKIVYRTLDKMIKQFSRQAQAKIIVARR